MKRKNKPKMEFSKQIFIGVTIGTIIVVLFSMYMIWRTNDTSVLSYLIGAVFVELATATGFYYHKAKEENKIKIAMIYKELELEEKQEYNDYNEGV